jgi:multisubunit Na+/H+ antiporter MnhG subunit
MVNRFLVALGALLVLAGAFAMGREADKLNECIAPTC